MIELLSSFNPASIQKYWNQTKRKQLKHYLIKTAIYTWPLLKVKTRYVLVSTIFFILSQRFFRE